MERRFDKILTIKISGSGPQFIVNASIDGSGSGAEGTLELPPELGDLTRIAQAVESMREIVADSADENGQSLDPRTVGQSLFERLFRGKVRRLFDAALQTAEVGVRIRLNVSAEGGDASILAAVPWELLTSRDDTDDKPIAFGSRTVLVRSMDVVHEVRPVPFEYPLRILLVASNPKGSAPLNLPREKEQIARTFGDLRGVEFVTPLKPTAEAIMETLAAKRCHVVHFMGHGDFDVATGRGLVLLENDDESAHRVKGEELRGILQPPGTTAPQLVFLNACRTATSSGRVGVHPFGSVSASLLAAGIPAVLGMQYAISDQAAIDFARAFYGRIAKGDPVDMAAAWARNTLFVRRSAEWSTPVLMLRPSNGVLFAVGTVEPHTPASPVSAVRAANTDGNAASRAFTVFLAATSLSQRVRSQLVVALQNAGIDVLPAVPHVDNAEEFDPAGHDRRVRELSADADLFVHLLGSQPGDQVTEEESDPSGAPNTFPVRQVMLGSQLLKPQLLLVNSSLDALADARYRAFLERQQNVPREKSSEFEIRAEHLNISRMVIEVARKRDRLLQERHRAAEAAQRSPNAPTTAFVDVGINDLSDAATLLAYLNERGVSTIMQLPGRATDARSDLANTADNVRKSSVVILFYGKSGYEYVANRFDWFRRLKVTDRLRTRIGVFVAPPPKDSRDLDAFNDVLVASSVNGFNPAAVDALLAEPRP